MQREDSLHSVDLHACVSHSSSSQADECAVTDIECGGTEEGVVAGEDMKGRAEHSEAQAILPFYGSRSMLLLGVACVSTTMLSLTEFIYIMVRPSYSGGH
jgi:hypothetical protein